MSIKVFSAAYLDDLVELASQSSRRRQHRNVHEDYSDPCQRLFNALERDTYLRPHRHGVGQGAETMLAVRGLMALLVFGDDGQVIDIHRFGSGLHGRSPEHAVGVETPPGVWHTVLALAPGSVLFEVKAGPFDPAAPRHFAPWAPEEGTPAAVAYLKTLLSWAEMPLAASESA